MSEGEGKSRGIVAGEPHPSHYGTFQAVAAYSQPVVGFPQPAPPPGTAPSAPPYPPPPHHPPPPYYSGPPYYSYGYQAIPSYATVAEGRPVRLPRLPCCGMGIGWFLFIIGFFLAAIPWYVGAFILLCVRVDFREKAGFIACTIAAFLAAIAVMLGATKGADVW